MIRANGILMTWLLIHTAQTEAGGGKRKEGKGKGKRGRQSAAGAKQPSSVSLSKQVTDSWINKKNSPDVTVGE